jgi:hypothetical protein
MEKNFNKTNDVRELGNFNILPLIHLLPEMINEWDKDEDYDLNPNKNMSLSQVSHVKFRWSDKKKDPVEYTDLPLWHAYKNRLLPIMQQAAEPFGYENGYFSRVMLALMPPGSVIPEHIDGHTRGWIAHKIHIPVITNPDAKFYVKSEAYYFEKGKAYEVNNGAMHGARNDGETPRIHLIFEYLNADINEVPAPDIK